MKRLVIVAALAVGLAMPAWGQDFALAEQGYARAQYNLGFMDANGEGVPQDYAAAVQWYRLAAEQEVAAAQNNLGVTNKVIGTTSPNCSCRSSGANQIILALILELKDRGRELKVGVGSDADVILPSRSSHRHSREDRFHVREGREVLAKAERLRIETIWGLGFYRA